ELLLGTLLFDEQSDLTADRGQHRQQLFVRLANLAAEKLHHADGLGAADDREPQRRMQPDAIGKRRAWKIRIAHDVGNPRWRPRRPYAARKANAGGEGLVEAGRRKLAEWQ